MLPSKLKRGIDKKEILSQEQEELVQNNLIENENEFKLKWNNIILICLFHAVAIYATIFRLRELQFKSLLWGQYIFPYLYLQ